MKRFSLITALSAAVLLSACSTPAAEPAPEPAAAVTPRATPTPTPTPEPDPEPYVYTVTCTSENGATISNRAFTVFWNSPVPFYESSCEVARTSGDENSPEQRAALAAYSNAGLGSASSPASIETLYRLCVSPTLSLIDGIRLASIPQVEERAAALLLCPDHPAAATFQAAAAELQGDAAAEAAGERFGSGTFRVGTDIQPGRYVVERDTPFDGCYWERTDAAGEIIDNNFINSGFRVEVTIGANDYSFYADGCGMWEKVG